MPITYPPLTPYLLQETKHWLAINKPAGWIVEQNPYEAINVESVVQHYLQQQNRYQNFVGIVHRLDRVTSGVLVLAKKKGALKQLNEQFRQRQVQKTYVALVTQSPPKKKGTLAHWLVKNNVEKRAEVYTTKQKKGSHSQLRYQIIAQQAGIYLLKIQPLTGKYHQIRAQLAAIGCPILGDVKYGGKAWQATQAIALHAQQLLFTDPITQEKMQLQAPLPPKMTERVMNYEL